MPHLGIRDVVEESVASVLRSKIKQDDEQQHDEQQSRRGSGKGDAAGKGKQPQGKPVKSSHIIVEQIEVGVPQETAYDQWTQFDKWAEMFKKESAKKEKKKGRGSGSGSSKGGGNDSGKLTATSKIGPSRRQWEVETVERTPARRTAWRAKGGVQAKGVTTFHQLDDRLTRIMVDIEYDPSGFLETVGNFFRMQRRRVRKDLRLFKNYIELRQKPTGKGPGPLDGPGLREDADAQSGRGQDDQEEEQS